MIEPSSFVPARVLAELSVTSVEVSSHRYSALSLQRLIRQIVNEVLAALDPPTDNGRP